MLELRPGCLIVSDEPEEVRAVLGSGIVIVAFRQNPPLSIATYCTEPEWDGRPLGSNREGFRFVDFSFDWILNQFRMQKTPIKDLVVKIFGGAGGARQQLDTSQDIGSKNLLILRNKMLEAGLEAASFDLGGEWGRELILIPDTGEVRLKRLKRRSGERSNRESQK